MNKTILVFGSHNHLPEGLSDKDTETLYQDTWKPWLTAVYKYPTVSVVAHYSGSLLSWLESKHPELVMLIAELVNRKQLELIGGPFFEAVLPIIPQADRIGQIESLTTQLRKRFGKRPRGCWLPLHAWEGSLVGTLCTCGMDYTFLPEGHFFASSSSTQGPYAPSITEDQGKCVTVFPLSTKLLDDSMKQGPELALKAFNADYPSKDRFACCIIDTQRGLQMKGKALGAWVEAFCSFLRDNASDYETILPYRYYKYSQELKKRYFPAMCEENVAEAAIEPEKRIEYQKLKLSIASKPGLLSMIHGPNFRQFFSKYQESNLLYSKMQFVQVLANQVRGDKSRKRTAREELWRGQSNDVYWHGSHGGIYDPKLRASAYRSLIAAEKTTRERGIFISSLSSLDFDCDGKKEYIFQGSEYNAYVHEKGGIIFELDYIPSLRNITDVMGPRQNEEMQNVPLQKANLKEYCRRMFHDRIISAKTESSAFYKGLITDDGALLDLPYETVEADRSKHEVLLKAKGRIKTKSQEKLFELTKGYSFKKSGFSVDYDIEPLGKDAADYIFLSEINLSVTEEALISGYRGTNKVPISLGESETLDLSEILIEDKPRKLKLKVSASEPFLFWTFPILALSMFQGRCFAFGFKLKPDAKRELKITVSFDIP